jgi:hypothetical protein
MKIISSLLTIILMATLTVKAQKLTEAQQEAADNLKYTIEGKLHIILGTRQGEQVNKSGLETLIELSVNRLEECTAQKVPDSYAFKATDYENGGKVDFTIKQVRDELAKWKAIASGGAAVLSASSKKSASDIISNTNVNLSLSADQEEVIKDFKYAFENARETIQGINDGDINALDQADYINTYFKEKYQDLLNLKLPEAYPIELFEDKKVTIAQIKKEVPNWFILAANAEVIRVLQGNYSMLMSRLDMVKQGNESTRTTSMELVNETDAALKKAVISRLPEDFKIRGGFDDPVISLKEFKIKYPEWRAVFTKGDADLKAKKAAFDNSFRQVLKDGKLKIYNEQIVVNSVA